MNTYDAATQATNPRVRGEVTVIESSTRTRLQGLASLLVWEIVPPLAAYCAMRAFGLAGSCLLRRPLTHYAAKRVMAKDPAAVASMEARWAESARFRRAAARRHPGADCRDSQPQAKG